MIVSSVHDNEKPKKMTIFAKQQKGEQQSCNIIHQLHTDLARRIFSISATLRAYPVLVYSSA